MQHRMPATGAQAVGPARHPLSPIQTAAVRTVMEGCVAEDQRRGYSPRQRIHCDACCRPRPRPGFVTYGEVRCCNRCATRRELARLAGILRGPA
jgi:hypothetical protein